MKRLFVTTLLSMIVLSSTSAVAEKRLKLKCDKRFDGDIQVDGLKLPPAWNGFKVISYKQLREEDGWGKGICVLGPRY